MMRAFWRCVALSSLLAAGGAEAQTRLASDEIPGPPPSASRDDVVVGRGPYAAVPPGSVPSDVYGEEIIPPFLAARIVRSHGYQPLNRPVRRGPVYTVAVIGPQGQEGRAILDAHTGRLMRFAPAGYGEDATVGGYGPPGPPPRRVSTRSGPRPPANVPHVTTRMPPVATATIPAPTASTPSAATPVATPDARPADAAPAQPAPAPAQQQAAASPSKPAADPVAAKPAPAPKPPVVLQPTQPLPPVQDFE